MSFQECELTILREAVDKAEEIQSKKTVNSPEIQKMIKIVENFLRRKKLICYGGTAINALLPVDDKFYNKETDLADYDFFSKNPVEDAKELANIFYKEGFDEVEAKSGQHHGTYKVFVNFIGMADITYLHKDIYTALSKEAKKIGGILYCPPNYLRMSMYLELSRPAGDVGRWEKVLKRLSLLNKHYPLTDSDCGKTAIQRRLSKTSIYKNKTEQIYNIVKNTLISEGVVFFGGYAISNFLCYMPKHLRNKNRNMNAPDFDVLSEEAELTSIILKERLQENGIKDVTIKKQSAVGEVITPHYQVIVGKKDTVAFIYEPMACHSFNKIHIGNQVARIATIDTILSLYLAFLYSGRKYYDLNRLVCIAKLLYDVQERNRLQQKGVLKRFSISCYGHQETVEEMRTEKSEMFEKLKTNRSSKDFEEWFLRYKPAEKSTSSKNTKKTAKKTTKKTSKTTKKGSMRRTGGKKGTRKKKLKQ
tara:strand:+ start:9184 stop:10611 length:1428 start_codon:yes stop_codon:yes gene_type:complete